MTTADDTGSGPSADEADPIDELPTTDDVAEELYGLDRDEFISRRDELAKAARSAGHRDVAAEIAALRKPSVAAWVANQLAREYPDEVDALEDLGASLREAQERLEGDALRRLSRQRHELVNALVDRGRRLARDDGVRLGDAAVRELERTITAALSEPDAARVLAEGRLVTSWEPGAGFGESSSRARTRPTRPRPERRARSATGRASTSRSGSAGSAGSEAAAPEVDPEVEAARQAEREAAEHAAAQARDEADRLEAEAEQADRAAADAERGRAAAAEAADALRDQLAELRERLTTAEDDERRTADAARAASEARSARRRAADDADEAARRAERTVADLG